MRTLKTIVFVLGGLLVAGFGLLVFGLTQNWHRLAETPPPKAATPSEGWGRVALGQPPDSRVRSVTPAGSFIVVQVASGSDERLLILDPGTGRLVGTFAVTERPAP